MAAASIGTLKLLDTTMNGIDNFPRPFKPTVGDCGPDHSGFEDLHNGTQVVVKDASGIVVGVGKLAGGRLTDTRKEQRGTGVEKGLIEPHAQTWGYCTWDLVVAYTAGSQFYGVEVSHRGSSQFSAVDLTKRAVRLTIMGPPERQPN